MEEEGEGEVEGDKEEVFWRFEAGKKGKEGEGEGEETQDESLSCRFLVFRSSIIVTSFSVRILSIFFCFCFSFSTLFSS